MRFFGTCFSAGVVMMGLDLDGLFQLEWFRGSV